MASVKITGGSVNITSGDEIELMHAIYEHGPVSVCYDVTADFILY